MSVYKKLLKAIKKHSGMDEEQIKEAGESGADSSWPGFTHNKEIIKFYKENKEDIHELLDSIGSITARPQIGRRRRTNNNCNIALLDRCRHLNSRQRWWRIDKDRIIISISLVDLNSCFVEILNPVPRCSLGIPIENGHRLSGCS